jgi:hypothetical protein
MFGNQPIIWPYAKRLLRLGARVNEWLPDYFFALLKYFSNFKTVTITEKISTLKDSIWIDKHGFTRIHPNEGFEFNETDVQRQFDTYSRLGVNPDNRTPLLVEALHDFEMTKEARELSAAKAKEYFTAAAIVSNSFTTRLLINFLNSFYNFGIPIKMFSNETEATAWLKERQL